VQDEFRIEADIVVLEGSRILGNGVWKRSYHIIFVNGVCASNYGVMKSFVDDLVEENTANSLFWWDDKGKCKSIVDRGVYTRNRSWRTPLSAKGDDPTATKLQSIERIESKDDADNDRIDWEPRPLVSTEEILECLVTYIPDDLRQSIIPDGESASNSLRRDLGVSRGQNQRPITSKQISEPDAAILAQVQDMIYTAGGSGCVVVYAIQQESDEGPMRIQCTNDGPRTCLVTKDEVHEKNNAYIVVHPDSTVWYHCHAPLCKGCDRDRVKIGQLSEPDSESSDDDKGADEAPISDVTTLEDESSSDDGHDDDMHDNCAPTNGIVNVQHDNGMAMEGDAELLQREGVDIAPSLGKRAATSISVGGDVLAENDKKRVCMGDPLPRQTTESSAQTWVFCEPPFNEMFNLQIIDSLGSGTTNGCKVFTVKSDRFKSGQGCAAPGVSSQGDTRRDPPGGFLLTARRDNRSIDFRVKRYVNGVVEVAERGRGRFQDPVSCAMVFLVVTAMTNRKTAKEMLLERILASKRIEKEEQQAWKKGFRIAKLVPTSLPQNLALRALQRLYVEGGEVLFKEEYDTYEVVKAEVEKTFAQIQQPFHYMKLTESGLARDYNPVTAHDLKGTLHNRYFYKYVGSEQDDNGKVIGWETKKCRFVVPWLADENLLTASKLDFKPSLPSGVGSDGTFNTWTGYDAERIPAVPDDVAKPLYALYVQHCVDVLGESEAKFMLDYFAHILQRPHVRTGVAVLITGKFGCGKGSIVDVFRNIIGQTHSFRTSKAKEHLFARFSVGLKKTVLVQVNPPPLSQHCFSLLDWLNL
jgi:hypothetical protein